MGKENTTDTTTKYANSKPFYLKDLLLYASVIGLVGLLFLFLIIIPKTAKANGFSVSLDNQVVFTFDYSKEEITIVNNLTKIVHDKDTDVITVYTVDGQGFNKLAYDTNNYTVSIFESNCPNHDCVDFFEISSGTGVIYCLPHGLKIVPLTPSESQPSTGGRL